MYRQLFNPQLYLLAYGRIYANTGAMTPGVTGETADGMSLAKIGAIIDALRDERYRWRPVKRVHIPKKNGKLRPLGLPTWSDKLVAEVVRLLLDAYYEPSSPTGPTVSVPAGAVTPRCVRYRQAVSDQLTVHRRQGGGPHRVEGRDKPRRTRLDIRNSDEFSTLLPCCWTNACWSALQPFSCGRPSAADSMNRAAHVALVRVQSVVGDRCLRRGRILVCADQRTPSHRSGFIPFWDGLARTPS